MDPSLLYGFWTWSRWWRARRRHGGALPAAAHRLRLRPQDAHASSGGNPSLLAHRRLPCALLGVQRRRARKRRSAPPQVNGA